MPIYRAGTLLVPSGPSHDPDRKHLHVVCNDTDKGLRNLRDHLASMGVDIEVFDEKPKGPPKPRGRPPKGGLSDDQWDYLGTMYLDPATDGGITIDRACELMGLDKRLRKDREKARQRLLRRFGSKGKREAN